MKWHETIYIPKSPESIRSKLERAYKIQPSFLEAPLDFIENIFSPSQTFSSFLSDTVEVTKYKKTLSFRHTRLPVSMDWKLVKYRNGTEIYITYPQFFVHIFIFFLLPIGLTFSLFAIGTPWEEFIEMLQDDPLFQVIFFIFAIILPILGPILARKSQIYFREKILKSIR